jgi:hypothetical protein
MLWITRMVKAILLILFMICMQFQTTMVAWPLVIIQLTVKTLNQVNGTISTTQVLPNSVIITLKVKWSQIQHMFYTTSGEISSQIEILILKISRFVFSVKNLCRINNQSRVKVLCLCSFQMWQLRKWWMWTKIIKSFLLWKKRFNMSLLKVLTILSNKMVMTRKRRKELPQHILINTSCSRKMFHHQNLMKEMIELLMSK